MGKQKGYTLTSVKNFIAIPCLHFKQYCQELMSYIYIYGTLTLQYRKKVQTRISKIKDIYR